MAKRNWQRCSNDKKKWVGKERELEAEWKQRSKYPSYTNGNFFIGNRMIHRYRPGRDPVPEIGIWVNAITGKFQVFKDHRMLSEITFKTRWADLILWAHRFGYDTTHKE